MDGKKSSRPELTITSLLAAELSFEFPDIAAEAGMEAAVYFTIPAYSASSSPSLLPPLVIIAQSAEAQLSQIVSSTNCIHAFRHQLSNDDKLALLKSGMLIMSNV